MAAGGIWCLWSATSALTLALPRLLLIPTLFLVVCLYGVAQMIHTPTSNALAIGSSPEALRGRYLAAFQYSFFLADLVSPSLFAFLFPIHPGLPWLVVGGVAIVGSLVVCKMEPGLPGGTPRNRGHGGTGFQPAEGNSE